MSMSSNFARRFMEMVMLVEVIEAVPLNYLVLVNLQLFSFLVECSFLNARMIMYLLFFRCRLIFGFNLADCSIPYFIALHINCRGSGSLSTKHCTDGSRGCSLLENCLQTFAVRSTCESKEYIAIFHIYFSLFYPILVVKSGLSNRRNMGKYGTNA
jgi:hypothetical protein